MPSPAWVAARAWIRSDANEMHEIVQARGELRTHDVAMSRWPRAELACATLHGGERRPYACSRRT